TQEARIYRQRLEDLREAESTFARTKSADADVKGGTDGLKVDLKVLVSGVRPQAGEDADADIDHREQRRFGRDLLTRYNSGRCFRVDDCVFVQFVESALQPVSDGTREAPTAGRTVEANLENLPGLISKPLFALDDPELDGLRIDPLEWWPGLAGRAQS